MKDNAAEPMRIVYFGTPVYAVPSLESLMSDPRADVQLVVTQPDRPAGRGRKLVAPSVKVSALEYGIPVYQPETLRTETDRLPLASVEADLFIVAAFGKVFGPRLLALPKLGCVNLHASLLPFYRGASPISAAILEAREVTGITLMQMDTGLDTGPILAQRSVGIHAQETTASLTPKLARLAAELLTDELENLRTGKLILVGQNEDDATITRPMVKVDGWIDWQRPARDIERRTRAMWDWPRAWTTLHGELVQIHRASVDSIASNQPPGTVEEMDGLPAVVTGEGRLVIDIAQNAGGRPLPGNAWLQQSRALGERLGGRHVPEPPALPLIRPAPS